MIVESTYLNGDIRYGLNILWRATKVAENMNLNLITPECLRLGSQELVPFSTVDILKYMSSQKLLFLLAIVKSLKNTNKTSISFLEILKTYQVICENLDVNFRSNSQLWNYLQEFRREGTVFINVISEKIKGRRSLIQIPEINILKLEKVIIDLLKKKSINF
jgi:Cdc6-like AAA superfamily ATPase